MGRVIVTIILVGSIAAGVIYYNYRADQALQKSQQEQIAQLQQQSAALQKENEQLKAELAKVQAEQNNLAAQNEALNKAMAEYHATGKMPALKLPYPPK
jgi:peptidoglycan hydrolase CwlO-like protein